MPDDTLVDDPSPEYAALMGSLDAYAMWEELNTAERLPIILDTFPVEEWFSARALPVMACFRTVPSGRWGAIKARFKAIGGNPFDLEKAVDGLLNAAAQEEEDAPASTTGNGDVPFSLLQVTDLADMLERTYPDPQWLIKGLIPEGLTFLVGSPKSSKTYLAYSLALSLGYASQASKQWLEHYPVSLAGPVVYITLEDDEGDSRLRIRELEPWMESIPRNQFLFIHGFDLPRLGEGLIEVLRDELIAQYHPAMIVIDPISYLYAPAKKSGDQFSEVKDMLLPLRWLGKEHHCAILGIDHRRKKSADDVDIFETTYGSNAKIAVADALLMIVRDDKEVTLHARVRKAMDQTITLLFEFAGDGSARWHWKGATDGIISQGNYGDLRQRVLDLLAGMRAPMTMDDILVALDIPKSTQTQSSLKQMLYRAGKAGEVQKTTRGHYVWSGAVDE